MNKADLYKVLLHERKPSENVVKFLVREYPKVYTRVANILGERFSAMEIYLYLHPNSNKCKTCAGPVLKGTFAKGFQQYCSCKCQGNDPDMKAKIKERLVAKYGEGGPMSSQVVRDKIKATNQKRYGCDNAMQNKSIQRKGQQTSIQRYGHTNPAASKEVKAKIKATWASNYEEGHPQRVASIRAQTAATNQIRYGGIAPAKSKKVVAKGVRTHAQRYEGGHANRDPRIQLKRRKTCQTRYGVDHPMHTATVFNRVMQSSSQNVKVRVNNIKLNLRGFEPQVVGVLAARGFKFRPQSDIPTVPYQLDGKQHVYYPDLYADYKDQQYLIEVKSTRYLGMDNPDCYKESMVKFKTAARMNYNMVLAIVYKGIMVWVKSPHRFSMSKMESILAEAKNKGRSFEMFGDSFKVISDPMISAVTKQIAKMRQHRLQEQ